MKRRTILKNAASTGLLALGATSVTTATTGDELDPAELDDDPVVSVVEEETGQRIKKPLSQTDMTLSDCCVDDDGDCVCVCECCLC